MQVVLVVLVVLVVEGREGQLGEVVQGGDILKTPGAVR